MSLMYVMRMLLLVAAVTEARPPPAQHPTPASRAQKTQDQLKALNHYEIVLPTQVDEYGEVLSYEVNQDRRRRRSVTEDVGVDDVMYVDAESHQIFYKLSAYGIDFHLNLTLNKGLLAPNYVSEFWDQKGVFVSYHGKLRQCHYVGHIANRRFSRVALSNCYGLHGIFATEKEEYFVEPLWNDTDSSRQGQFHIVYKRSAIKSLSRENHCGVKDSPYDIPHWLQSSPTWKQNDVLKSLPPSHPHKHKWRSSPHRHRHAVDKRSSKQPKLRHRRSISTERNVEILVVVDKMMVGYHGKQEIEPYVLTVMNIVANLYHDASIGNVVNLIVTRLVLLTEEQPDLEINHHADRSLESFCRWQHTINPNEETSESSGVAHHDNAVLITRYDICTHMNQPCGTLGLAPVAGMCEPDRSCSINEDIGLATAFTIAHEIGHNFGMQHDGIGNLCGPSDMEPAKIMAPLLTNNTDPFSWSKCSMNYITNFLDSGRGQCLDNSPLEQDFTYTTVLPGQIHDANAQCKFQYGASSRQCRFGEGCRELYCIDHNGRCDTTSIPAAEGTACSTSALAKGWCYKGECMEQSWSPEPVAGNWGDWSPWGTCSRTCGGGVESSERFCNTPSPEHGGKYCLGERRRYQSCNIHDCPINSVEFREVQCAEFNEITFRGKFYKWKPFTGVGQMKPCALNCLATGYNFYTERAPKVKDGTRCYSDSLDICINGICKHVGCDRILGSDAVEDMCRVCGGDGTTCETVSGDFTDPLEDAGDSYQEVVKIPQGAVHIKITETVVSRNYLALKAVDNDNYYINGAYTIDWPRKFEVANTVFRYERPREGNERLTALGPTSHDLLVMILLQENNLGISYEYNLPIINETTNGTNHLWEFTSWSPCSTSCGKGISEAISVCVNKENRSVVKNELCIQYLKPNNQIKYCNEDPCPPEWHVGEWTECSLSCGGGYQTRSVVCVQQVDTTQQQFLPFDKCPGTPPRTQIPCNKEKCPPHWATDGWSDCKPSCGAGMRNRNVYCVSAEGLYMQEENCEKSKKPNKSEKCNNGPCPPPRWVSGQWGECSAKCGQGQTLRRVECKAHDNKPSKDCREQDKPHTIEACEGACTPDKTDEECKDVNKVAYCPLVLKFDFCNRAYFRQMCCKTCSEAGF